MAIAIEQAQPDDAWEVLSLQLLAYQDEAERYGEFNIPPLRETPEQVARAIREERVLKAVVDGRIVGAVRGRVEGDTCHVGRLVVHPKWRRRGLGRQLMEELERRTPGVRRFELFTGERSERNLRLYESLGYRRTRREPQTDRVTLVYLEKVRP